METERNTVVKVEGKSLKERIKSGLMAWRRKEYEKRAAAQALSYDLWIREKEAALSERLKSGAAEKLCVCRIPYEACGALLKGGRLYKETAKLLLFTSEEGEEASFCEALVSEYFTAHPEALLAYGDEDVMDAEGVRHTPWLKPDWSPDTFLSCFYFGSVFAVRVRAVEALSSKERGRIADECLRDAHSGVYLLCRTLAEKSGGFRRRQGDFPIGHIDEILYHSHGRQAAHILYSRDLPWQAEASGPGDSFTESGESGSKRGEDPAQELLSVIIPSKDHPETLMRCIESVERYADMPYEILVVDNGSEEGTRKRLAAYLTRKGATYIYAPAPFHFSAMCNRGAAAARGLSYLFLNDDVEAAGPFLSALYKRALRPWEGAVGAKLLYPETKRIQHAGIVNLRPGPVHKLQFWEDTQAWEYGFNRGRRNVIAVTGACLAVEAEKFWRAGGFPEELPVAFNDVDLCFSLYEKGYYNVALQDVSLYHAESLSRGQDEEPEKLKRLFTERRRLYERHPKLYGKDPFYHKYYAQDILSTGFETGAGCEWRMEEALRPGRTLAGIPVAKLLSRAREDGCVRVGLEYAGTLKEYGAPFAESVGEESAGEATVCYVQGYCFVTGSDNARYEKKLLLRKEVSAYAVRLKPRLREDVERNLPDQEHTGLSGFRAVIDARHLEKGDYRIGVLVIDRCSMQLLYHMTNRYLHID